MNLSHIIVNRLFSLQQYAPQLRYILICYFANFVNYFLFMLEAIMIDLKKLIVVKRLNPIMLDIKIITNI